MAKSRKIVKTSLAIVGELSDSNYEKIDLHKHIVDEIVLSSPDGIPLFREKDLIDVWFDSGVTHNQLLHWLGEYY